MSSEQLSMDFAPSMPPPEEPQSVEMSYDALDHQLSDLMHQLNGDKGDKNPILKHCTLEISQHTREGQIAIKCNEAQQAELLKTTVVGKAGDYKPLILDKGFLYLRRYWQYQQKLADQIKSRLTLEEVDDDFESWAQQRLDYYFGEAQEGAETDWQKVAAERALKNKFLIISGGPGTGKTTTITRILALLIEANKKHSPAEPVECTPLVLHDTNDNQKHTPPLLHDAQSSLKILLAAPTGKAAIRMLDAINQAQGELNALDEVLKQMPKQASTIHKLLGYIPEKVSFKHHKNHPLNADVVLIDEASMIDIAMMSKLIEAVPAHAKLILIGDKNQLSSVETGSVFADMCDGLSKEKSPLPPAGGGLGRGEEELAKKDEKKQSHIITLQKNYRFKKDSAIGQLAIATNQGDSKTVLEILKDKAKPSCQLIAPSTIEANQIPAELIAPWENYLQVLNNPQSSTADIFKAFNQYRILCTLRRGLNGSTIMSNLIETALAKQGYFSQKQSQKAWYHGRPIMITQNSYSKGLFNGDTGICLIKNGEVKVYFPADGEPEGFKSLAPVRLPAFETTWAMTIHKSQGSEFEKVTLILPHEVMPLLTRQLIYTGITRAKEQVSIVASEVVLNAGVKTEVVRATQIAVTLFDK